VIGQCDDLGLFVRRGKGGQHRGDDLLDEDQCPMARAADGLSADADAASSSEGGAGEGTVKLRRNSQNRGRGLSSCRVNRAAPLRRCF
jgi:hypothetical protein